MINLLFISNNSKLEAIKNVLQPMLKIKINIVKDFDHGLRDVFEKRPTTIIIQEQISGVTGESVARHIQMLLGASAPTFILVHEGNPRIKPVKALFEHLIDLTQPHDKLIEDIQDALKAVLGAEWEKIVILPKPDRAAIAATFAMPEENRLNADRLVEDFISDLETADSTTKSAPEKPHLVQFVESQEESYVVEDTFEILNRLQAEINQVNEPDAIADYQSGPDVQVEPAIAKHVKSKSSNPPLQASQVEEIEKPELPDSAELSAEVAVATAETSAANMVIIKQNPTLKENQVKEPEAEADAVPSGADFKILPDTQAAPQEIPEDILAAFAENYHSQRRTWKKLSTVFVAFAVLIFGGWYFLKQSPQQLILKNGSGDAALTSVSANPPAQVLTARLSTEVQKPASTSRKPVGISSPLPSFVPANSRDYIYSTQKPGWERYLGKHIEYRIFRSGAKIKAVQILAAGADPVSEVFLREVLQEIAGSSEFQVFSKENKQGYFIQRGNVGKKTDLMIYRTQKGRIRAFVVSPG
ncbi:MAG TPA: hypothetical protein VGJ93_00245 [Desulfuromonadaceae bacterium]|jgi:flagellar FliL protein